MVDFHSHILPGIDDGSSSVNESIQMLQLSHSQGITKMVATPHFYAAREAPDHFIYRREKSWKRLMEAMHAQLISEQNPESNTRQNSEQNLNLCVSTVPEIILGAEVCYYEGITHTRNLQQLCIGSTNVLLLEMPFHEWSSRMIDEVIELARTTDLTILLAHIDRYLSSQQAATWELLSENDVLFQANASCFLNGWVSRHKYLRLLREGAIAVLGSDCHNMSSRKPNLGEACRLIEQKAGKEVLHELNEQAEQLLRNGRKM